MAIKFHKAEDLNDKNKITFGELYSKTLEREKLLKEMKGKLGLIIAV